MAQITDGTGTPGGWKIDTTTGSGKIEICNSSGQPCNIAKTGSYMARVEVIPTTLIVGTTYWSCFNTGTNTVLLEIFQLIQSFSGAAGATRSMYGLCRYSGAEVGDGTITPIIKKNETFPTSSLSVRYSPAGLTIGGITFSDPFYILSCPNQLNNSIVHSVNFGDCDMSKVILAPNEGIVIRAYLGSIIAGSSITGTIHWSER